MPLVKVPFQRIAIDLVGPLPKGKGGFQYMLVMVDYATRYPEAVPLRSTRAKVLAAELLKIFSRVGFPSEVLTDQGTNLMGEVMTEMWGQLGVHHVHTSVMHPQCNGLVERYNKSVKGLLRKFAIQNPQQWPQLVEPILFTIREVPQASTGLSPFELLFGRRPRGILDLLCDQWTGQKVNWGERREIDIEGLQEKLKKLGEWARTNLAAAQEEQKGRYDQKVELREFAPGDRVLLLIPSSDTKLIAKWQGPYVVKRRLGKVDYEIETPDKRDKTKIFHVNLLKGWKERTGGVYRGRSRAGGGGD